jgi:hypothetical protein
MALRVGLRSWLFFLDLEVPRAAALSCGRKGEASLLGCRSWPVEFVPVGFVPGFSRNSEDTLPFRRVASCWGLFVLVCLDLSPSWRMSEPGGTAAFASPVSRACVEAIASGDAISMLRGWRRRTTRSRMWSRTTTSGRPCCECGFIWLKTQQNRMHCAK